MIADLAFVKPSGPLYRIARGAEPWVWPDWAYAGADRTFGNRYDDPRGEYRVIYASSQRLGAFLETLACFRPDPAILAAGIAEDEDWPSLRPGVVPTSWAPSRAIGTAGVEGAFADVGRARSLAYLRRRLADRIFYYELNDLDAAAIRLSAPRAFTQEISRLVYECVTLAGARAFQGIRYRSRLGDEVENWAVCEPATFVDRSGESISPDDPDLVAALDLLGLELAPS